LQRKHVVDRERRGALTGARCENDDEKKPRETKPDEAVGGMTRRNYHDILH
jgi:hypothetical protein